MGGRSPAPRLPLDDRTGGTHFSKIFKTAPFFEFLTLFYKKSRHCGLLGGLHPAPPPSWSSIAESVTSSVGPIGPVGLVAVKESARSLTWEESRFNALREEPLDSQAPKVAPIKASSSELDAWDVDPAMNCVGLEGGVAADASWAVDTSCTGSTSNSACAAGRFDPRAMHGSDSA
jgi:hypothetical protein